MSVREQTSRPHSAATAKEKTKMTALNRPMRILTAAFAALVAMLTLAAGASAFPAYEINSHHAPSNFQAGGVGSFTFSVQNGGDKATGFPENPVTVDVTLPAGVTTRKEGFVMPFVGAVVGGKIAGNRWVCLEPELEGVATVHCTLNGVLRAGYAEPLTVFVSIAADASGPDLVAEASVSGGTAAPISVQESAPLGPEVEEFGVDPLSLFADAFEPDGSNGRQAGSHPFRASFGFDIKTGLKSVPDFLGNPKLMAAPNGTLRDLAVTVPPGLVGNPTVVAECPQARLGEAGSDGSDEGTKCPPESQIGTIDFAIVGLNGYKAPPSIVHYPVYNMVPPDGALADFALSVVGRPVHITAHLDPRDYSIETRVSALNETLPLYYQRIDLWGVPADPAHDGDRWNPEGNLLPEVSCAENPVTCGGYGASSDLPRRPFLSLPTECGVPDTTEVTRATSWQHQSVNTAAPNGLSSEPITLSGCGALDFEPTVSARPTTNVADAPTGLEFEMHIPQNEDPDGLATAHLRDAVVKLPEGMTVNPPSALGLGACSLGQISLGTTDPVACPDASKLGTVEAVTPALENPIHGAVYLAAQNANPFNSLIAMYLVLEDEERGLLVKLPGKVDPDPSTGQLTATFKNNPQLPVEDLKLDFFAGPRAALKTPSTCGTHTITSTLTPWSSPEGFDASRESGFELTQGAAGGACLPGGGSAPNAPGFSAGTMDPTAKAFSPFVMKLSRADGTQQIKAIDTTLPKGLLAKLAGTTYCADAALAAAAGKSGKAERTQASCPASSHVGSVNVGAGAGSTPLYVQGQAYLAGPYKGAPLSLAIVTPAVAGPFDLGTVVVRAALNVNPETAQVRAVSDELPTILQGIPLNIRSIALQMNRPQFTLNPTNCNPMSIDGSALTVFNQSAALTNPFQVGECNTLGFKPKLQIKLKGSTKRAGHPALTAVVSARPGDANIATTSVALPRSEFLAQDHIRTICTRVQFAADACPQGSIYGTATATTPLLDEVLTGNVYLRSSTNPLPDMVIALKGKIDVDLVGRIDTDRNGGIRTTFASVPDAPVSKFTLKMAGGKKSLLENSKDLCSSTNKATLRMGAQNGASHEARPVVKSAGCGKARKGKKRKGGKARG